MRISALQMLVLSEARIFGVDGCSILAAAVSASQDAASSSEGWVPALPQRVKAQWAIVMSS